MSLLTRKTQSSLPTEISPRLIVIIIIIIAFIIVIIIIIIISNYNTNNNNQLLQNNLLLRVMFDVKNHYYDISLIIGSQHSIPCYHLLAIWLRNSAPGIKLLLRRLNHHY